MNEIFFQSLINVDKWNEATWKATAFFSDNEEISCLGIVFLNWEAGKQIFQEWHQRFGNADTYEELRISIIEGDIPGVEAGYTVHINSEPLHTEKRAKDNKKDWNFDISTSLTVGRFNRMNPAPNSPHLSSFKKAFDKHHKYWLIPVTTTNGSLTSVQPHFDFAIKKTHIHFRHVSDIIETDIDSVVLKRHN